MNKPKNGSVTIDGVTYTAFMNTFSKTWYIVIGHRADDVLIDLGIKATTPNKALLAWMKSKETK